MPRRLEHVFAAAAFACVNLVPSAFAQTLDEKLQASVAAGDLPGLHSAIIDLGDQRLAEVYFPGEDESWGQSHGVVDHGPETLHDLRSVTKSVVGLLYGIALADGDVPAPEASLYAHFPQYPDLAAQKGRERILIDHVLSMKMGLEWNENVPYVDKRNSEVAMEWAEDRYRFVLEQPIVNEPGEIWTYSGGATALLGKLIEDGTGQPLDDFADKRLFKPLGISDHDWIKGADGVPSAASGLRLTLPDLMKIGHMVARNGVHDGKQVVPADWLARSFKPRARISDYVQYGYLWYIAGTPEKVVVFAAGNGGQRLTVQLDVDLVVASFAGLYNDPDAWKSSFAVVSQHAVPAAKQLLGR